MATQKKKNNHKTCLGCCIQARKEGCMLCPDCDEVFNVLLDKSAKALLAGQMNEVVPVDDKFQYVIDLAEGNIVNPNDPEERGTLLLLEERAKKAEELLDIGESLLWEEACDEIMERVKGQVVGQKVIDRAAESLLDEKKRRSQDYDKMSKRAFGYKKAFQTGKVFLAEVKTKRAEFLRKKAKEESEKAQAKEQDQQEVSAIETKETVEKVVAV